MTGEQTGRFENAYLPCLESALAIQRLEKKGYYLAESISIICFADSRTPISLA